MKWCIVATGARLNKARTITYVTSISGMFLFEVPTEALLSTFEMAASLREKVVDRPNIPPEISSDH